MSSVQEAPLAGLLRAAEPATAVAFVAALYEARGWTVRSSHERVLVVSDGGPDWQVAVVHPADGEPIADVVRGTDRAVCIGDVADDAELGETVVVEPATLHQQLAYALSRQVALELLETHFDWSPGQHVDDGDTEPSAVSPADTPRADETIDEQPVTRDARKDIEFKTRLPLGPGRWKVVVGVVVVVLLIGTAVALTGGSGDGGPAVVEEGSGSAGPTVDSSAVRTPQREGPEGTVERPSDSNSTAESYARLRETNNLAYADAPPGIVAADKTNIHQITGAYQEVLDGRSYRLSLSYQEFVDGQPTGVYTETINLESNDRYTVRVSRLGRFRTQPFVIAGADQYANGSVEFERLQNGSVRTGPVSTYDPFLVNTTQYLGWLFSVRNVSIADRQMTGNTTTYHVETMGDPDPDFLNATGSAFLTEEGLLKFGRWEFTRASNPEVRVVVRMRVTGIGSTTATPPVWVNGTD